MCTSVLGRLRDLQYIFAVIHMKHVVSNKRTYTFLGYHLKVPWSKGCVLHNNLQNWCIFLNPGNSFGSVIHYRGTIYIYV